MGQIKHPCKRSYNLYNLYSINNKFVYYRSIILRPTDVNAQHTLSSCQVCDLNTELPGKSGGAGYILSLAAKQ